MSSEIPTPSPGRPNLRGKSGPENESLSILSSIEINGGRPASKPQPRFRWQWVAGASIAICVTAAYMFQPTLATSAFWRGGEEPSVAAGSPKLVAPVATSTVTAVANAEVASAPARIESMDLRDTAAAPVQASAETPDAIAAFATAPAALGASSVSANATPEKLVVQKPSAHHAAKTARRSPDKSATLHAVTHTRQRAARGDSGKDPDVDLLAALMAHVGTGERQGAVKSHVASSATHLREPVQSADGPTIAMLVKRCDGLSGAEATHCRRRICEGYWGKAQACPAESAPATISSSEDDH